jgi:D-beta-D-heptose 7-phosphate kinase/D-beta-D-heptose 1-phosphate adenosyltransferase
MFDFEDAFKRISGQTILCIGDLMLDDFVYGEVSRISPEAPAPVLAVDRSEVVIGGAGNVARSIVGLGARCIFVGVVGADEAGRTLSSCFSSLKGSIEPYLVTDTSRPTTRKVRFVSEHYSTHLLRADWERAGPASAQIEKALIDHAVGAVPHAGAVVLSDYAKGALTPRVIAAVIEAARRARKPVVVDPKSRDFTVYRGADIITPNRMELAEATRHATRCWSRAARTE